MINKKRLIKLTQDLIRINSENPTGNESEIALFVSDYLKELGLKPKIIAFQKNRSNVLVTIEGKNKGKSLLITPHLDTVPAGKSWKIPAFSGKIIKNRIYGLGATDCKCNLAVSLEVIKSLAEQGAGLDYNLIFSATADEESGSDLGLIHLLNKGILKPSAALVLDADDFSIIVAQKGLMHLKVKLRGKKAHGAYPWRGVNAIDLAMKILSELKKYKFVYRENKYLRAPTINVGTIKGGDKVNVVADWCEFELDFRFLPGMSHQKILNDLKKIIGKSSRDFTIKIEGVQKPYLIDDEHPLVSGSKKSMLRIESLYKGAQVLEDFLKRYRF